jgi:hypothetical protein
MCGSSGNYGSTAFDPLNGENLAFNICDDCITIAGEQGRVMVYQGSVPVVTDTVMSPGRTMLSIVGWMKVDRPYLPWTAVLPQADERFYMSLEDILNTFHEPDSRFHWNLDREGYAYMLQELDQAG